MIVSGTPSSFLPPRAPRSRSTGLLAANNPCHFGSGTLQRHGKTRSPRKIPTVRDRDNNWNFRYPVECFRRYDQDRTLSLLLVSLRGIRPDQPDFAALHQMSSPPAGFVIRPLALFPGAGSLPIALREKLIERIARSGPEAPTSEPSTLQRGRHDEHDRATDPA